MTSVRQFGAVDADEHKELAGRFGVQGFPTLKVFVDKPRMNPYTNKKFRPANNYNGARTARGMKKSLMNLLPVRKYCTRPNCDVNSC